MFAAVPCVFICSSPSLSPCGKHHQQEASIPVPCPDWGPSSRSPRQCRAVMKCRCKMWCMAHAFESARDFKCLSTKIRLCCPARHARTWLSASVYLTVPTSTHLALLHRAPHVSFFLCKMQYVRTYTTHSSTPIVTKLNPDYAARSLSSRLLGCQCHPQTSQTRARAFGLGSGLGQGLYY